MSPAKLAACRKKLLLATEACRKQFAIWRCATCGKEAPATVHQLRKTYCSKSCMAAGYRMRMSGAENPNYRDAGRLTCKVCGGIFRNYNKARIYCSLACRDEGSFHLRTGAKKDANHNFIVGLLEAAGATVVDLSKMAGGVPDILVWYMQRYHLIEIKNPNTSYGKKGLNKRQKEWAQNWQSPVYVVRTEEDAQKFIAGRFDEVENVTGATSAEQKQTSSNRRGNPSH